MRFKVSVDRIEDGIAVLLPTTDDRSPITVPKGFLPRGTNEGYILWVSFEVDEVATVQTKQRVRWLLAELEKRGSNKSKNKNKK